MSTTRPARAAVRTSSRDRAREARLALDAERARRDEKIEDAAAKFFDAVEERAELVAQLDGLDTTMGAAIEALTTLGEPVNRIAALLDIDVKEVRRLRPAEQRKPTAAPRSTAPAAAVSTSLPTSEPVDLGAAPTEYVHEGSELAGVAQ
jgi:hypothetical protein